jgi:hypothetical protein
VRPQLWGRLATVERNVGDAEALLHVYLMISDAKDITQSNLLWTLSFLDARAYGTRETMLFLMKTSLISEDVLLNLKISSP